MFSFSSKKILSKLLSLLNKSLSALKISGRNIYNHSAFTLTELIVVITILSILSVIGFVVMSHQWQEMERELVIYRLSHRVQRLPVHNYVFFLLL
jgi:prepilin-type N-terminal cleavage/methylation domain-containing protein